MKIGFIKFGLKTYFNKSGSGQGSNHELIDVFNIMEERGHDCFMVSNVDEDKKRESKDLGLETQMLFVFNGPLAPGYSSKMNMFQGTMESLEKIKKSKLPWIYFWTDPRKDYDIRNHQIFKDHPPIAILSQEKEFYGHLDKLVLYRQKPQNAPKSVFIAALMNYTDPKRSKRLTNLINHLSLWYDNNIEIRGDWKKHENNYLQPSIPEHAVLEYLRKVKYGINIGKNDKWVSQKYWEMLISGVMCFYENYDEDELVIKKDDFRKLRSDQDLVDKIKFLESSPEAYAQHMNDMHEDELKEEYFTGDFIYDIIMKKIS